MDENAVVESVCTKLHAEGCDILSRCTTKQRGIDIVARKRSNGHHYYVEAKGSTSSRSGSNRFGKPYTQSQLFDRVAKGVFTCLQLREKHRDQEKEHVVLALPEGKRVRSYVTSVSVQLEAMGIEVWFLPHAPASGA